MNSLLCLISNSDKKLSNSDKKLSNSDKELRKMLKNYMMSSRYLVLLYKSVLN